MKKEDLEKKIMDDYDGTFIKETIGKFAVDDFKASLREEIENLLKITENELEDNTIEKQAWMEALEKTLQLLDTVKPFYLPTRGEHSKRVESNH